jgi:hypothetical protein
MADAWTLDRLRLVQGVAVRLRAALRRMTLPRDFVLRSVQVRREQSWIALDVVVHHRASGQDYTMTFFGSGLASLAENRGVGAISAAEHAAIADRVIPALTAQLDWMRDQPCHISWA